MQPWKTRHFLQLTYTIGSVARAFSPLPASRLYAHQRVISSAIHQYHSFKTARLISTRRFSKDHSIDTTLGEAGTSRPLTMADSVVAAAEASCYGENVIGSKTQARMLRRKMKAYGEDGSSTGAKIKGSASGKGTASSNALVERKGTESKRVLVVGDTLLYRHLATSEVLPTDTVVDVGCSRGHTTALIAASGAELVLGVDIGVDCIATCQRDHAAAIAAGNLRFHCSDIFASDARAWAENSGAGGATVLFLDIGGNRDYMAVANALRVCRSFMPNLRLVVVKCKELRSFLRRAPHTAPASIATHLSKPWVGDDEDKPGHGSGKEDDEEYALSAGTTAEVQATRQELCNGAVEELQLRGGEAPLALLLELRPTLRFIAGGAPQIAKILAADARMEVVEVDSKGNSSSSSSSSSSLEAGDEVNDNGGVIIDKKEDQSRVGRGAKVPDNYKLRIRLSSAYYANGASPADGSTAAAPRAPPYNAKKARSFQENQEVQTERLMTALVRDLTNPKVPPPPAPGAWTSRDGVSAGEPLEKAAAIAARQQSAGRPLAQLQGYSRRAVNRYVLACPEPSLYAAASGVDPTSQAILDARYPKPWCETWQAVVNMRHLLFFVASRPHLFRVVLVGSATTAAAAAAAGAASASAASAASASASAASASGAGAASAGAASAEGATVEGAVATDPRKGLHAGVSTSSVSTSSTGAKVGPSELVGDEAGKAAPSANVAAADVATLTVEELLRCCVSSVGPPVAAAEDGKGATGEYNNNAEVAGEKGTAAATVPATSTEIDAESGWWLEVLQGQWARTNPDANSKTAGATHANPGEEKRPSKEGEMFLRVTATNQWDFQWQGDA